jgi:hypothetical protein
MLIPMIMIITLTIMSTASTAQAGSPRLAAWAVGRHGGAQQNRKAVRWRNFVRGSL